MTACTHQLQADAQTAVLGVISAREHGRPGDAGMLIQCFRDDAKAAGVSDTDAWAMLFTASTVWAHTLLDCRRQHHQQTFGDALLELSALASQTS